MQVKCWLCACVAFGVVSASVAFTALKVDAPGSPRKQASLGELAVDRMAERSTERCSSDVWCPITTGDWAHADYRPGAFFGVGAQDGWFRDGLERSGCIEGKILSADGNAYAALTATNAASLNYAVHSLGSEIGVGVLRISADMRAPAKWAGCYGQATLRVLPVFRKYFSQDSWRNAFAILGSVGPDYNQGTRFFALCGNEDGMSVKGCFMKGAQTDGHWYRYVATYDLDAETFAVQVYDMGTSVPKLNAPIGKPVAAAADLPFAWPQTDDTGPIAGIAIYGIGLDSGADDAFRPENAGAFDNLAVDWKTAATPDFVRIYENDFTTRRSRAANLGVRNFNVTAKSVAARRNFDICAFGARTDADAATNRAAIQKAVDAAAAAGGGRVVVPTGLWNTGSIELKSHVELSLAKGATLKGSVRQADYNRNDVFPENFWSNGEEWSGGHLIYAYKAEDVAITGEGVIDGNGPAFFDPEPEIDSWFPNYKYGLKLHPKDQSWYRPGPMVAMFLSKNIRLAGVTLKNTPCWTAHFRCCDGLDARGVTIDADRTIANSDGFSIDCTRNVVVRDCTIRTGDDGFAIRASCRHHAAEHPCENIHIENCDIWSCCYGVRFGIGTGTIRHVDVVNCRVQEASDAFGFTPAWVNEGKSVYISDICVRNCTATECVHPVGFGLPNGDAKAEYVLFENCAFNTLLPCDVGGNAKCWPRHVHFRKCSYKQLPKQKVRQNTGWLRNQRKRSRKFVVTYGKTEDVKAMDCTPGEQPKTGALVLSFDDRNFAGWKKSLPIFRKYSAHATFFVSGKIDPAAVKDMKTLRADGHSVGLHGLHHANADEAIAAKGAQQYFNDDVWQQLDWCHKAYVPVSSFAYPNCRRTDESDKLLYSKGFDRVRGGVKGLRPYDPTGEKMRAAGGLKPLVTDDRAFFPASELPKRRRLDTIILGEAYHTDIDDVCDCIRRAAARKEVLVFTSHDIGPNAKGINLKTEWLEKMLKTAQEAKLPVLGFDELPLPE